MKRCMKRARCRNDSVGSTRLLHEKVIFAHGATCPPFRCLAFFPPRLTSYVFSYSLAVRSSRWCLYRVPLDSFFYYFISRCCQQTTISQDFGRSSFGLSGGIFETDGERLTIGHFFHYFLHLCALMFTLQDRRSPGLAVSRSLVTDFRWLTFLLLRNSVYAPTHIC